MADKLRVRRTTQSQRNGADIDLPFRTISPPERAVLESFDGASVENPDGTYTTVPAPFGGTKVIFPFGPQNLQHDQIAAVNQQVARPGMTPLLVKESKPLRTCSFQAVIAQNARYESFSGSDAASVEDIIDSLTLMARESLTCSFQYGFYQLPYDCVITQLSVTDSYRDHDGSVIRAQVNLQLTERPFYFPDLVALRAVYKKDSVTPRNPAPVEEEDEEDEIEPLEATGNAKGSQDQEQLERLTAQAILYAQAGILI